MKNPFYYHTIIYGFFALLGMTISELLLLTGIDSCNRLSNKEGLKEAIVSCAKVLEW
jgi:hypothetical protein